MDAVNTSDSSVKIDQVTVQATPKGGWRVYVDGKDFGLTVKGNMLSDQDIDDNELRYNG